MSDAGGSRRSYRNARACGIGHPLPQEGAQSHRWGTPGWNLEEEEEEEGGDFPFSWLRDLSKILDPAFCEKKDLFVFNDTIGAKPVLDRRRWGEVYLSMIL